MQPLTIHGLALSEAMRKTFPIFPTLHFSFTKWTISHAFSINVNDNVVFFSIFFVFVIFPFIVMLFRSLFRSDVQFDELFFSFSMLLLMLLLLPNLRSGFVYFLRPNHRMNKRHASHAVLCFRYFHQNYEQALMMLPTCFPITQPQISNVGVLMLLFKYFSITFH